MFKFFAFAHKQFRTLAATALLGAGLGLNVAAASAQQPVNTKAPPNDFVQVVADNALQALKKEPEAKNGNIVRLNELVNQYVLPYVNFEKTTQLAAGRYWRQATAQQKADLVEAFKGTLIRTYSGALRQADSVSSITPLPFRGDVQADDVVVRTSMSRSNGPSIGVDYRLEKTAEGWRIYDLNVEGIWLIQNYRNQFAQQITQTGIDGLIKALNDRNQR
ncbi:MAG: ABC transporter substrate-binding protein [Alcaligenaceae bacterium]|nr:ABC transporter substrate-binding protein [Alcaligenaceae bacterium]